jgi:5-methylcytosine-specific restriction endonuclease McrA
MALVHCLDCGQLSERSRCQRCARARRGTTSARGYGAAHQRRARQTIAAQPFCSICGATTDLTADHIVPLARGGHPHGELRVLCRRCNSSRGAQAPS